MTNKSFTVGMLLVVCASLFGCARGQGEGGGGASEMAQATGKASSYTFVYRSAGIDASSRVDRHLALDGSETLQSSTEVSMPGAPHPLVLSETATIAASGKLVLATAVLRRGLHASEVVRSVELDAAHGRVTVSDEKGEKAWLVASDAPWMFTGAFADVALETSGVTAVEAWVARRAAQTGGRVRSIDVGSRSSQLTIGSQVVLDDGASAWIVVGNEAVETDGVFLRALPWKALDTAASALREADLICAPGPV